MNIVSRAHFLSDIEPVFHSMIRQAIELLEIVRGVQELGFQAMSYRDLSARQFHLVNYLSAQLHAMKMKMK